MARIVAERVGKGHHVTARVSCTAAQRCSSGRTQGTATEMIWLADPPIETAGAEAPGAAGDQSENGPASTIGVVRRPCASAVRTPAVDATARATGSVAGDREAEDAAVDRGERSASGWADVRSTWSPPQAQSAPTTPSATTSRVLRTTVTDRTDGVVRSARLSDPLAAWFRSVRVIATCSSP
jgi:hypothetical protein